MAHCGCWFLSPKPTLFPGGTTRHYLPQVELKSHTQILSTASRTRLTQTFVNDTSKKTPEVQYTFPLYDGVSVVSFKCIVGDKIMLGFVKEKNQARTEYEEAVSKGQAAGLLEQTYEASDVFSTRIGNIPKNGKAVVEIEYVGELKHDAQLDGIRFSIPTSIAPRYGTSNIHSSASSKSAQGGKIEITVDVEVDEGANIESLSSPTHPITMTIGRTTIQNDEFKSNRASATLSLGQAELGKDFIVVVNAQDHAIPRALLEEHPKIARHRALMTTLVPKFNLPNIHPEIVFVVDRSGSMGGKMPIVIQALKVFLKSLPLSAKFNICSFGSGHSFLFPKSVPYDGRSLQNALNDVERFGADYGGTELLRPIQDTVKNRLHGIPLEIMVLTDGEIWNQQDTFDFVNGAAKDDVRLFSLGIGAAASTSLVEGIARAGNGFAQFVQDNEKMDKRVMRMLKAALTPHITDYKLEVNYVSTESESGDDFEMVEPVTLVHRKRKSDSMDAENENATTTPISLFDKDFKETAANPPAGRYDHLPPVHPPNELQAPNLISGLFPYNRVCAYLLLPDCSREIKSVMLKGTYNNTPVQLEIPVQNVGRGKTIHQLAAKAAMLDTEEGRGWLSVATTDDGTLFRNKHASDWERIVEREAVRLGVKFQIAGKYCSFVATERGLDEIKKMRPRPASSPSSTLNSIDTRSDLDSTTLESHDILKNFDFDDFLSNGTESQTTNIPAKTHSTTNLHSINYVPHSASPGRNRRGTQYGSMSYANYSASSSVSPSPSAAFGSATFGGATFGSAGLPSNQSTTRSVFGSSLASTTTTGGGLFRNTSSTGSVSGGGGLFGNGSSVFDQSRQWRARKVQQPQIQQQQQQQMQQPQMMQQHVQQPQVGLGGYSVPQYGPPEYSMTVQQTHQPAVHLPYQTHANHTNNASAFGQNIQLAHGANFLSRFAVDTHSQTVPDTVEAKMHALIGLQTFDGSWNAQVELFKLVDVSEEDFHDTSMQVEAEKAKATILAIAWLEKVAYKEMEVWEMVVDKARQWLQSNCGVSDVDDAVRKAIGIFFA